MLGIYLRRKQYFIHVQGKTDELIENVAFLMELNILSFVNKCFFIQKIARRLDLDIHYLEYDAVG